MKTHCDECGGNLKIDQARAEGVCEVCSLVHEHLSNDADTNSATSLGDGRHNEAVNREAGHAGARLGGRMNPFGDRTDGAGNRLTPQQRRLARRLGQLDRSSQRDTDPMYTQLMNTIRTMFGEDMARSVEPLARATARKLTPAQEARRKTLTPSERRRLKCPKTSICRAGGKENPELRGGTDQENLRIMALAIVSIAAKLFRTVSINEKQLMDRYGITQKQLLNARKTITKHYQARVSMGWAARPTQLSAAAAREDELDKATENIAEALTGRVDEKELVDAMQGFLDAMTGLGEPSVDAPTANVAISMVAGCVMYNLLQRKGLAQGNLNAVAKAVGRSGAGIKSRLDELKARYEKGTFPEGAVLFAEAAEEAEETTETTDEEVGSE